MSSRHQELKTEKRKKRGVFGMQHKRKNANTHSRLEPVSARNASGVSWEVPHSRSPVFVDRERLVSAHCVIYDRPRPLVEVGRVQFAPLAPVRQPNSSLGLKARSS